MNRSHHGDNPLLRPTEIQIATKSLPGSTNREHRKLIGVKTQDDVFGYELQFLLSGVLPIFQNLNYKLTKRLSGVLPIQRSHQKCCNTFSSFRRVTRRQVMRRFTSNDTDHFQNVSSNLLTPYREQPRSTRIIVAYPRPAFSATKRTNHAPISFGQQTQVSQDRVSYRKIRENIIPRSMVVKALRW